MNFLIPDDTKMTDNDIIRALECCISGDECDCPGCPSYNAEEGDCQGVPWTSILDLINRQKAENSNLTSNLTSLKKDLTSAKAEIERLQEAYKQVEWERDAERRRNLHLSYDLK